MQIPHRHYLLRHLLLLVLIPKDGIVLQLLVLIESVHGGVSHKFGYFLLLLIILILLPLHACEGSVGVEWLSRSALFPQLVLIEIDIEVIVSDRS